MLILPEPLPAAAGFVAASGLLVVASARIARALAGTRHVPLLETFVVTSAAAAFAVAASAALGLLSPVALVAFAVLFFATTWPLRRTPTRAASPRGRGRSLVAILAIPLAIDLPLYLATPPVNWDAMTYHLYLPARWIQEGRLVHVPTVFGDNAAAYAPQNGALLFGWSMTLLRSDVLANVLQWTALGALAIAAYRLARTFAGRATLSPVAVMAVFWIQPLRAYAASGNVDVWMLAFFVAAAAFLVSYARRPRAGTLACCALAAGLACGTKTIGVALGAPVVAVAAAVALARRRFADAGLLAAATLAGGGWWYLRNLWLYRNPLFPLKWAVFDGAYENEAIRAGEFHLEPAAALARTWDRWGVLVCLWTVAGLLALAIEARLQARAGRPRRAGIAAGLALFGAAWIPWFLIVVPHNAQTRFLFPALALAVVGWAGLLARLASRSRGFAMAAGIVVAVALGVAGRPDGDWGAQLRLLRDAGSSPALPAACLGAALACGWVAARFRDTAVRRSAIAAALVAGTAAIAFAVGTSDRARPEAYTRTAYRSWAAGFLPFQNPEVEARRVAYAGANIPYTMTGRGLRHTVLYCNTQGHPGDGFYEHWRRDAREYDDHKPAPYRGADDAYDTWLACLRERRIDTVVLFAMHPAERRRIPATESGFTLEQRWIAEHPERFDTVYRGRFAEIHRLMP